MELESYFEFLSPDDIRIKGTRIGIENVLYDYLHRGRSAEDIAIQYPSLTLEQVYAALTYYLHDRETLNAYLEDWLAHGQRMQEAQKSNPPPIIVKLRARAVQRQKTVADAS